MRHANSTFKGPGGGAATLIRSPRLRKATPPSPVHLAVVMSEFDGTLRVGHDGGTSVATGAAIAYKAKAIIDSTISVRTSSQVPKTQQVSLEKNEGVEVTATYVYADMVGSSALAQMAYKPVTAKIIRSYINGASSILREFGGDIKSFDGDRVMAIFIGEDMETRAVRAALAVNWLVDQELSAKIAQTWTDIASSWRLKHSIGIDRGDAVITRGGVRGDNDLISIGSAPNVAAKLSDLRDGYSIHITKAVYEPMSYEVAIYNNSNFWHQLLPVTVGGKTFSVLATNAYWGF